MTSDPYFNLPKESLVSNVKGETQRFSSGYEITDLRCEYIVYYYKFESKNKYYE